MTALVFEKFFWLNEENPSADGFIFRTRQDCFTENYTWFYGHRCFNGLDDMRGLRNRLALISL